MRKTSVYLDEDQAQRLARLAREEEQVTGGGIARGRRHLPAQAIPGPELRIGWLRARRWLVDRGRTGGGSAQGLRRVTVVIDAGPLVAFGDANDPQFARINELLRIIDGPLIIPAPVTAEVDYLLDRTTGTWATAKFHRRSRRWTIYRCLPGARGLCHDRELRRTLCRSRTRARRLRVGCARCSLQHNTDSQLRRAPFPRGTTAVRRRIHDPASRHVSCR